MNAKPGKSSKKAVSEPRNKKVKPYQQLKQFQSVAEERDEQRKIARSRIDAKARKAALAARMAMTNYQEVPSLESIANTMEGVRVSKPSKKGKRNQKATASDRKAAKKAERLAARQAKQEARQAAKQAKLQARAERAEARAEAKHMANMPAVEANPAMIKEVLAQLDPDKKWNAKRAARIGARVEQLFGLPPRKLANRIRVFQFRIALFQAVLDSIKQAVDNGVVVTGITKAKPNGKPATKAKVDATHKANATKAATAVKTFKKQTAAEINKAAALAKLQAAKQAKARK